jgi:hypothetical protein
VVLLRSRVHLSPSPVGRPLSNAGRDGGGPLSPAPSTYRPSPSRRTGQVGWGVSPAVPLASLRRSLAAPCRPGAAGSPDHPASAFRAADDTQAVASRCPCGFRASRLHRSVLLPCSYRATSLVAPWRRRPVRVIRGWCLRAAHVPGPRPGKFSRPGRWRFPVHRRRPWDLLIALRSFGPTVRVSAPSSASRSHPPAVSPRGPPRVPSIAGPGFYAGS